ncbi:hypothetical protein [Barnesiella intestinihominis]|uniref:hypothetical protein n=1 Tax=Barnesiella intestinihominis TaxID=487174 RepID=UPI003A8EC76D
MKRRDKTEVMRDRLQLEDTRLLFQIDEAAEVIEKLSAGQIYSAYGAKAVERLDALTNAEERLSEAIEYLNKIVEPKNEFSEAN